MNTFRAAVPFIEDDRILHDDIQKAEQFLKNWDETWA
jgi:histidine ammonia-lyase